METEFLHLGRDLDEMVMATNTRRLNKRVLDWIRNLKEKKWPPCTVPPEKIPNPGESDDHD